MKEKLWGRGLGSEFQSFGPSSHMAEPLHLKMNKRPELDEEEEIVKQQIVSEWEGVELWRGGFETEHCFQQNGSIC